MIMTQARAKRGAHTRLALLLDLLHPVSLDAPLQERAPVDVRLEEEEKGGAVPPPGLGVPVRFEGDGCVWVSKYLAEPMWS